MSDRKRADDRGSTVHLCDLRRAGVLVNIAPGITAPGLTGVEIVARPQVVASLLRAAGVANAVSANPGATLGTATAILPRGAVGSVLFAELGYVVLVRLLQQSKCLFLPNARAARGWYSHTGVDETGDHCEHESGTWHVVVGTGPGSLAVGPYAGNGLRKAPTLQPFSRYLLLMVTQPLRRERNREIWELYCANPLFTAVINP